jgi:hypothetical protein
VWWQYIIGVAVLIVVIYSFMVTVGYRTRLLTRRTDRTAEEMYDSYAGLTRRQRRQARKRAVLEQRSGDGQADR